MRGYRPLVRLPQKLLKEFQPWSLPPALHDLSAQMLADLWQLLKAIGHPDLPYVHVLKGKKIPWLKVSAATNSFFLVVTVEKPGIPTDQSLIDADHETMLLGPQGRAVAVWHRDVAPEQVGQFIAEQNEEMIAHGILNSATGIREEGYNYVLGWVLPVHAALPDYCGYIKIRPCHDAGTVWQACEPRSAVTLVPNYYRRTILCRAAAARLIFGSLVSQQYRTTGRNFDA